ncbi:MAG: hypothetical protein LRZ88_13375 [Candidatus Cloacimonetes bacterium]|nr:hypothetical protein [Candidatus Cloacimonadota bacterium]
MPKVTLLYALRISRKIFGKRQRIALWIWVQTSLPWAERIPMIDYS